MLSGDADCFAAPMESIKSVGGDAAKNRLVKKNELKEIVRRHNNVKNELESSF